MNFIPKLSSKYACRIKVLDMQLEKKLPVMYLKKLVEGVAQQYKVRKAKREHRMQKRGNPTQRKVIGLL